MSSFVPKGSAIGSLARPICTQFGILPITIEAGYRRCTAGSSGGYEYHFGHE
jgi:hypothetical protein